MHEQAHAYHIRQSVERADFVEVDLVDGVSVHFRFCVGDQMIDSQRVVPHGLRQIEMRQQVLDFGKSCVMVVRVFMIIAVFVRMLMMVRMLVLVHMCVQRVQLFFAVDQNLHMRARNAALDGGFC